MISLTMISITKPRLITALQFLLWWAANSFYAIDAQYVLRRFNQTSVIVDLSLFQVLVGLALAAFINLSRTAISQKNKTPLNPDKTGQPHRLTTIALTIGFLHIAATILTNFSYRAIGSTSTLVWKLSEPCAAVVLKAVVLHEYTDPVSLLGVLVVVAGVLIYSIKSLTMMAVSPIVIANILFPTRNVFVKLDQKQTNQHLLPEQRFFLLLRASLPFCLCVFLIRLLFAPPTLEAIPYLLRNALLFNTYQFASIALLEKLDALTHSLANTMKRFLGILLSALILGDAMRTRHLFGLSLTAIGFPLYAQGGKLYRTRFAAKYAVRIGFVAGFLMVWMVTHLLNLGFSEGGVSSIARWEEQPQQASDITRANAKHLAQKNGTPTHLSHTNSTNGAPPSEYIVLASRYVRSNKDAYDNQLDKSNIYAYLGKNLGNLVWEHAAFDRLPDFSGVTECTGKRSACVEEHPAEAEAKRIVYYFPVANIFNLEANRSYDYYTNIIERGDVPLVIGAGVQESFAEEMRNITDAEEQLKFTLKGFRYSKLALGMFEQLEKHSYPMFMRGDLTQRASKLVGYNYGISAGCPSLMINEDVYLGRSMEAKYSKLKERIGDKSLKIGLNVAVDTRVLFNYLLEIFYEYPNSIIFAQGKGDAGLLSRANVPMERVRMFSDVQEWMTSMKEMDVAFGGRIHGNMIALGASVPTFVIAPDWRVLELVRRMKIPHMTRFDKRLLGKIDVAEVMYNERIRGAVFDENRCRIAKKYREVFGRFGIGLQKHVQQISQIC